MKKFVYFVITVAMVLALSSCATQTTVAKENIGPSKIDNTIR